MSACIEVNPSVTFWRYMLKTTATLTWLWYIAYMLKISKRYMHRRLDRIKKTFNQVNLIQKRCFNRIGYLKEIYAEIKSFRKAWLNCRSTFIDTYISVDIKTTEKTFTWPNLYSYGCITLSRYLDGRKFVLVLWARIGWERCSDVIFTGKAGEILIACHNPSAKHWIIFI